MAQDTSGEWQILKILSFKNRFQALIFQAMTFQAVIFQAMIFQAMISSSHEISKSIYIFTILFAIQLT